MVRKMSVVENYLPERYLFDQAAVLLLEGAEFFRAHNPPKYKMAIKCLKACFKTLMTHEMTSFVNFQIGKLYFYYTKNIELARHHLEQAYHGMKEAGTEYTKYRVEIACSIAEVYMQLKIFEPVKQLLRKESAHSRDFPLIHARLLFLLAEIHGAMNDWNNASEIVEAGASLFNQLGDPALECYFRLSSAMIISMDLSREEELMKSIMEVSEKLVILSADNACLDYIKAFCCTVQICFFISAGLVRRVSLELADFSIFKLNVIKNFDKYCNYVTGVYSVWVKAHKYHSIAMRHITDMRRLMAKSNWPVIRRGALDSLAAFEIILLENISAAQLMLARPVETISVLGAMMERMRQSTDLFSHFEAQLHTLLGMYCWFVHLPDDAERQFQAALRTAKDTESWTVVNLSLAILYLMTCREADFYGLFERITPGKLQSSSSLLKASAHFVHALHSYLHSRLQEAKSHITDSVTIVRDEGVPRIQALATLLSAKLVAVDVPDMLIAANNFATKSSDHSLALWLNQIIFEIQMQYGHVEQAKSVKMKFDQMQAHISQAVQDAINSPAHSLIQFLCQSLGTF
uniref:MAU2 chromatid cohesion factor homolog n=1 Tax=Elaeophora elaphi TaxID=1147741 RepID=A0A0R3RYZ3_9BILA